MDELLDKISSELEESIYVNLQDNELLKNSNEIRRIVSWIKESNSNIGNITGGAMSKAIGLSSAPISMTYNVNPTNKKNSTQNLQDENTQTYSKLLSKVVEILSKQIASYLIKIIIKNIRIKIDGDTKTLLFDLSFKTPSIKPYIEFVKKIEGLEVMSIKTIFHVQLDTYLKDVKIKIAQNNNTANIDTIIPRITLSLMKFANVLVTVGNKPLKLSDFSVNIDSSKFDLKI